MKKKLLVLMVLLLAIGLGPISAKNLDGFYFVMRGKGETKFTLLKNGDVNYFKFVGDTAFFLQFITNKKLQEIYEAENLYLLKDSLIQKGSMLVPVIAWAEKELHHRYYVQYSERFNVAKLDKRGPFPVMPAIEYRIFILIFLVILVSLLVLWQKPARRKWITVATILPYAGAFLFSYVGDQIVVGIFMLLNVASLLIFFRRNENKHSREIEGYNVKRPEHKLFKSDSKTHKHKKSAGFILQSTNSGYKHIILVDAKYKILEEESMGKTCMTDGNLKDDCFKIKKVYLDEKGIFDWDIPPRRGYITHDGKLIWTSTEHGKKIINLKKI